MSSASYKVSIPTTLDQVQRPLQVQALDRHLASAPLVWVLGLPGAGKTSAAAQWVHAALARGERCLWYRLDEDDADVAGLIDSLRHHPLHGAPQGLPAWSPDHRDDPRRFARRFFAQFVQARPGAAAPAAASDAPPRMTLVLDDCHCVPDSSLLFELLDAAREVGGHGLRLLLISRRPPPPLLQRGMLAGWLRLHDDLGLALDEATAVAEAASGRRWQADEIAHLHSAHGWLAHVLALARSPAPGRWIADSANPAVPDALGQVADFLSHELLLMLPAAQRRPFRLLAELPELPRALAQAGAGGQRIDPAVARLLDPLAARRYFVDITEANAWRLHDLLRDGLRAQNLLLETPDTLAAQRRELALWVLADAPDVAMNLLVAAGDGDGALALLRQRGRGWLAQGRHQQMLGWLDQLDSAGADAADTQLWRAEALLPTAPEAARPLFATSRALLVARGDAEGASRAWCGQVASYVVQWGAVQGLAELVDELELLEQRFGPAPGEWRFRTAADALTALMYGRAEDPRIRHHAQATALAVQQAPDPGSRTMAAAQLLIYRLWWAGDFPGGRALYDSFDAEVDAGTGLAPLVRLVWWSNAAIVDWQCGDPIRCYAKVDRGLALAEASGVHVRDFFLLTQGIFCALSQEDWPRAEAYLAQLALTERSHRRLDTMVHHFFRSWYALSRGDAAQALAQAEAALPMAEALGSLFHKVIVLSALAPAALHAGDLPTANAAYRAQLALAKGSQNPTFAYIAFCAGAEIALVTGDEPALRKQVERMLTVKHLGGFHSDCGWRTPMRSRLLAFALDHGVLPDVARQWIAEKRVPPPPGAGRDWPMPVRIAALAGLDVAVAPGQAEGDAKPVNGAKAGEGAKPSQRLRELLAVLVACRAGATQAELVDWLWPDADGDKAAASLKVAVHRLRGWLGHDAVLVKNSRVALNPARVGCDLWWCEDHAPHTLAQAAPALLAGCNAVPVQALRQRWAEGLRVAG